MTRCDRCAAPLPVAAERAACGQCSDSPPPQRRTIAALSYAFPWDGLIGRFKFHDGVELAAALSERLARAVDRATAAAGDAEPIDLVVPVPLSRSRLRQRGYNQAWELARRVARLRRLPAEAGVLRRLRDTGQQSQLARSERQRNVRAAFGVEPGARPGLQGRHVALVDDVMTSGATVAEAAAELMRAGARSTEVWVLARTAAS